MLALRTGGRRLAAAPSPFSSHTTTLHRALLSSQPPRPPTPLKKPTPTPPPPGKPTEPTASEPSSSGGLGVGSALGMAVVAGGVAAAGYYAVLADEAEKRRMEGYLTQAKAMVGLGGPCEGGTEKVAVAVEGTQQPPQPPPPHQVGTFLQDVKDGAVHATEEVKGQLKRAVTKARHVAQAVEETVEAAMHPNNANAKKEEEAVESSSVVAKAKAAVEQAEQLAEEIVADIKDAVVPNPNAAAAAAHKEEKEEKTPAPAAAPATTTNKKAPATVSVGQKQTEAARQHFATYEGRAKDVRYETMTRAAEEALAQGEALRRHLEATLLKDLGSLGPDALRQRVAQLAGELQERTKWEALRLHEAVRKAEIEVAGKYVELVEQLREESAQELGRQARALEAEKTLALQEAVAATAREWRAQMEEELAAVAAKAAEELEAARANERAEAAAQAQRQTENALYEAQSKFQEATGGRLAAVEKLQAEVQALDAVFETDRDYEHVSHKVHRVSAAIMAFELGLLSSQPLKRELSALKHVTQGDALLEPVLESLPPSVEQGVPTLPELQVRFPTVQSAAREAAFVPESAPGLAGHLLASALAAVTITPRGLVQGKGADEVLARAAFHVERGDLPKAVAELDELQGRPGKVVADWLRDAKGRLLVEQAVRAMSARSALLNSSLV